MQLILLTPPETISYELEVIHAAFQNGLDRLHVRKPDFSDDDYLKYVQQIQQEWYSRIVLHGARHLYHQLGLGGIHYNSRERLAGVAPASIQQLSPEKVSSSFHSWQEIAEADTNTFGRLFISPLFNSISKAGYLAATQPEGIKTVFAGTQTPKPDVIGLGGVSANNITTLKILGYDGAAVLGAVWHDPRPTQALKEIMNKIR